MIDIVKEGREGSYLMEVNNNSVFVASGEKTINVTVYRDGNVIQRSFNEFIDVDKIQLETFNIAPTNTGGIAILAWLKQSINTRDLLFLELDDQLRIVKRN